MSTLPPRPSHRWSAPPRAAAPLSRDNADAEARAPADCAAIIEIVRAQRSAAGLRCVHCASTQIRNWGRFSGRRRYRCAACRRTFSDLTATPLAYSKHLDRWLDYCACMMASATIRDSARRVGIDPATSFRWRHRLLDGLRRKEPVPLVGFVEIAELALRHSQKGSRRLDRPAHRRGGVASGYDRVVVILACDRQGGTAAVTPVGSAVLAQPLRAVLLPRLAPTATLLAAAGPYSAYARMCAGRELAFRSVLPRFVSGDEDAHVRNAIDLRSRFRCWLRRFRGVATKYLRNYLRWFEFLVAYGSLAAHEATRILIAQACIGPCGAAVR